MSVEIHAVTDFSWFQKLPNVVVFGKIDAVYGEAVIGARAI
jgi:hypothetical protein